MGRQSAFSPFAVALIMTVATTLPANSAMKFKPAPRGEATEVAQQIIQENFDAGLCSLVVKADRFGDGSIRAVCNNGEAFRVFSLPDGKPVAMRCKAAKQLGVTGC